MLAAVGGGFAHPKKLKRRDGAKQFDEMAVARVANQRLQICGRRPNFR
jgi:hypothetical protein